MSLPEQTIQFEHRLLTGIVRENNPDTGTSLVLTYTGTDDDIQSIRAEYEFEGSFAPIGYGYKTNTTKASNGTILTVRIPEGILYTDRWNLDTETVQDPLWYSDLVRNYMLQPSGVSWGALDLSVSANLVAWLWFVKRLETLIDTVSSSAAGSQKTLNDAWAKLFPEYKVAPADTYFLKAWEVVFTAIRDGTTIERNRPVLRRCRYMAIAATTPKPPGSPPPLERTTLTGPPLIYTTAKMVDPATWEMPSDIVTQISSIETDLPTKPPNTVWSWKLRRNDSEVLIGSGKFLEVRDWVFGRWSTITHTLVG